MKNTSVNRETMDQAAKLYYLYCMNSECRDSIYGGKAELRIPVIAKKWIGTYRCNCCNQALVPAVDAAINQTIADDYRNPGNKYLYN